MTFAIAGVSGNTGKVAAEALLARGKKVRVIVRDAAKGAAWKARGAEVAVADLADTAALTAALRGVEGAYVLVPPSHTAASYRANQDEISRSIAAAVREARVPHVVLLSSVGAHHPSGTGPIAGLHVTEGLLGAIEGTVVTSVRAGYFLENVAGSVAAVKDAGVLPSFFPAALTVPMIGTQDIGKLAAQLLLEAPAKSQVIELGTPRSFSELAATFGKLLGKTVQVQEVPLDAVAATLEGFGMGKDIAGLYAEMSAGVVNGKVAFEGGHRRVEATDAPETVLGGLLGG